MSGKKARVGDIDIAYELHGPVDAPVVMMAHAMGTSRRIWDLQVPALENSYRVLCYDWRGHGDTDAPKGPYTLSQFNDDAIGLMDVLKIDKVHWVGISTGGMIGQGLGIHHGDRLHSLTLCNTISQATAGYQAWVAERQQVLRDEGMETIWDMTKRLWFTDEFVDAAGDDYRLIEQVFVRTSIQGYIAATTAVSQLAYRDDLHLINVPTRIIAAGADPVTPPDPQSTEILERISQATLTIIKGQRHFSNVEVPHTFNTLLRRALDEMAQA